MEGQNAASNKITQIVRLRQMLNKWKKLAVAPKSNGAKKSIGFLKRTLSLSDTSIAATAAPHGDVPKGYLAVCVGEEKKRFVIPTDYLGHRTFRVLLREAEEEFGFQQEGVLRIPCQVAAFESILKAVEKKSSNDRLRHCSTEAEFVSQQPHHPQKPMCR